MKFDIIYADPPWSYENKNTGGSMKSGASYQYQNMTIDEICALPVPEISNKSSVLFLWVTTPLNYYGFEVMNSWGFEYKTKIYWQKIMSLGMGFWFRGQVEELWLGIKGDIKAFRMQEKNWISAKVERHSKKPEVFRKLIERSVVNMPSQNKIELFARQNTNNWASWGNEITNLSLLNFCNQEHPTQLLSEKKKKPQYELCL